MPVSMGVTILPEETDRMADQIWALCTKCNGLQLLELINLNVLYATNHSNPVGQVWADHHSGFAAFVEQFRVGNSIIEIGGGSGILAGHLLSGETTDLEYCIIEPDFTGVEHGNLTVVRGYVEDNLDLLSRFQNTVHSHVLEHLYSPISTLSRVISKMPTSGRMIFSFPNLEKILAQGGSNGLNFEHTYYISPADLRKILGLLGLSIVGERAFQDHSIFFACEKPPLDSTSPEKELIFDSSGSEALQRAWLLIEQVAQRFNSLMDQSPNARGYVFGAHVFAQGLFAKGLDAQRVLAILDNDKKKINKRLSGTNLFVQSPDTIVADESPVVALMASHYQDEIRSQLVSLNPSVNIVEV